MKKRMIWMWLICLLPIAAILILPAFGKMQIDASWLFLIVILSACMLPMLFMRNRRK